MKPRRRKNDTTKAMAKSPAPPSRPMTVVDIPDKLLRLILIGLSSVRCIVRAAPTCRRWRRIIACTRTSPTTWRYIEDLCTMPSLAAGHYQVVDRRYATPPRGSGDASNAVFVPYMPREINSCSFSLDFLPTTATTRSWELIDSHDSFLLLAARTRRCDLFPDLVVCEPLIRRYEVINYIPKMKYSRCLAVFFYYVMTMADYTIWCVLYKPIAGVVGDVVNARVCEFIRGYWNRWFVKRSAVDDGVHLPCTESSLHFTGRTATCLYWAIGACNGGGGGAVLAFDMRSWPLAAGSSIGKFSLVRFRDNDLGSSYDTPTFRFIDGDNRHAVRLVSVIGDDLKAFLGTEGGSLDEWELGKSLCLPEATRGMPGRKECFFGGGAAKIVTAGAGYVVLTPAEETWLFSVEIATMEVERKHSRNKYAGAVYPHQLPAGEKGKARVLRFVLVDAAKFLLIIQI